MQSGNLTRHGDLTKEDKHLTDALVGELFRIKPQDSTHAYPGADGYVIATLTQVTSAPDKADPKMLDAIREDMKKTFANEMVRQYLAKLREEYPISINAAALNIKQGSGE